MPQFSIIITTYQHDANYLPRIVQCLINQTLQDFETIVMVDGTLNFNPEQITRNVKARVIYTPKVNTCGFRQRAEGITHATGKYLVWLNADNLIYRDYLQSHGNNFAKSPDCVSVVNIHYWLTHDYWGVLPRQLACGHVDLLNYSLPKELAIKVNAFGTHEEHIPEADWHTLNRARHLAPVEWDHTQPPVGCHF